jgi:hypothetical protein
MTMAGDAQQKVEAYLGRLRQLLRGMNAEDAREIIDELRSHLMDRVAASGEATDAGVDAALAALGSPEELANEYLTHHLLARAEASRSPVRILESLFRWASLSVAGFFVLVGSMMGYFLGIVFLLVAALKPFHPQTAGLWLLRDSAGFHSAWIRHCAGRRQGRTRLVDRTDRATGGLRGPNADHTVCPLVCAAISQIAPVATKLI